MSGGLGRYVTRDVVLEAPLLSNRLGTLAYDALATGTECHTETIQGLPDISAFRIDEVAQNRDRKNT